MDVKNKRKKERKNKIQIKRLNGQKSTKRNRRQSEWLQMKEKQTSLYSFYQSGKCPTANICFGKKEVAHVQLLY